MTLPHVSLDDKYTLTKGRIFLSGTQALARLPLMQRQLDIEAGLGTAGYISGYRGSPLGAYDRELWRIKELLSENDIVFQPGVNEDLAATAIWGTQQSVLFPEPKYDGVFSIWYGKGPGVDRSGDVFKHANLAGTSQYGGVLAVFGDDHGAKSSTLAHQSEQALVASMIPVLAPATVGEILDFGLIGWAMSRFAGVWVGLKCVNEVVESTASVDLPSVQHSFMLPEDAMLPEGGINIRMDFEPLQAEQRLLNYKLPLTLAFARANKLDKVVFDGDQKRLGIVAAGKAYNDVRQALEQLGIDEDRARDLGIGLYKVGLTWPIEPTGMKAFSRGFDVLLFIEEKRALIEDQVARLLYDLPPSDRPKIYGKLDEKGARLLPSDGTLDVSTVFRAISRCFKHLDMVDQTLQTQIDNHDKLSASEVLATATKRLPYFCSGCPHNTSTKVPENSIAMAGIGCSFMAIWMNRNTVTSVQMGGEGANWNGIAPFTGTEHVFQNLGDGTYFHSGLMAIRAAVSSGVNITYKILFNDAVAMTGGQPVDGNLTVPQIVRQVEAEGVTRIIVVTDEPEKYGKQNSLLPGTKVYHRRALDDVQNELKKTPGTTILIYDQTCAAEKRRRRKRKQYPDKAIRAFINDAVCEGCGDCSVKSNCVSILPLETRFGRKRQIDQSSCNKDYSCVNGFCPSFVTVHGGKLRKAQNRDFDTGLFDSLPEPKLPLLDGPFGAVVTGIGGTGVVTIGALLGMAAHIEGKGASIFDITGLAQKNGAVLSHLRISDRPDDIHAVSIGVGEANLLLGCDLVVSGESDVLRTISPGNTHAIINSNMVPTGDFQLDGDVDFQKSKVMRAISGMAGDDCTNFIDATSLATSLMGDSIATNMFMVGYAWQKGMLPLSREAIEQAIEINNVAVDSNKRAFCWGRLAACDLQKVITEAIPASISTETSARPEGLEESVAWRTEFLTDYKDRAYGQQYSDFVELVKKAELKNAGKKTGLADAVARSLFKLMAYKDEYEIARLFTNGAFEQKVNSQFDGDFRLRFHLAPPLLARRDPTTGEPRKMAFGPWVLWVFKFLRRMKGLRGTPFDLFGYTEERKIERQLIKDYQTDILSLLGNLTVENHACAIEFADWPMEIKGFGHVKMRNFARAQDQKERLLKNFLQRNKTIIAAE